MRSIAESESVIHSVRREAGVFHPTRLLYPPSSFLYVSLLLFFLCFSEPTRETGREKVKRRNRLRDFCPSLGSIPFSPPNIQYTFVYFHGFSFFLSFDLKEKKKKKKKKRLHLSARVSGDETESRPTTSCYFFLKTISDEKTTKLYLFLIFFSFLSRSETPLFYFIFFF